MGYDSHPVFGLSMYSYRTQIATQLHDAHGHGILLLSTCSTLEIVHLYGLKDYQLYVSSDPPGGRFRLSTAAFSEMSASCTLFEPHRSTESLGVIFPL
jgi:hypothetical protein